MDGGTRSFQEVLSELRSTKIRNDLPSPAEILHGRSLITGEPVTVDHAKVKAVLIGRQIKDSQQYNKSHRVKSQRALVLGERCWGTGTNNEWSECYITGIDKENRCYQVVFEETGRSLRRTRSHLRPCMGLTFLIFQRDFYSRMHLRVKTRSFQKEKGKIKQIMKKPQSYQDHHIIQNKILL